MSFIDVVPEDAATGDVARIYAEARDEVGYVPNFVKAFCVHPAVWDAWQVLAPAVGATLDKRRYELVTVAAARRLRSSYCSLAHAKVLHERFLPDGGVLEVFGPDADPRTPLLDDGDRALMALAEQVVTDASEVTGDDVQRCRDAGVSDDEIAGAVMVAAMRCFFSKTIDALGAAPDAAYHQLDAALREAMTVGRPIEPA